GTNADGTTSASNCTNWTTTAGAFTGGDTREGPAGWTAAGIFSCTTPSRLLCVMKRNNIAISSPPVPGKRIVITNGTFTPNAAQTPDQRCIADAGANYRAL